MTENILALFRVPSLKYTAKLITKDKLADYCLKSWLEAKAIQAQQGDSHGNPVLQRFAHKARQALHNKQQMKQMH